MVRGTLRCSGFGTVSIFVHFIVMTFGEGVMIGVAVILRAGRDAMKKFIAAFLSGFVLLL